MTRLEEIGEFAKANGACKGQYKAFIKFLEDGNEQECWNIILGDWE